MRTDKRPCPRGGGKRGAAGGAVTLDRETARLWAGDQCLTSTALALSSANTACDRRRRPSAEAFSISPSLPAASARSLSRYRDTSSHRPQGKSRARALVLERLRRGPGVAKGPRGSPEGLKGNRRVAAARVKGLGHPRSAPDPAAERGGRTPSDGRRARRRCQRGRQEGGRVIRSEPTDGLGEGKAKPLLPFLQSTGTGTGEAVLLLSTPRGFLTLREHP